jgi:lipopolysaccharide export system permease protein
MPTESRRSKLHSLLPNPIDGYVLSEVLGPFLGGTVFFCFVLLMFQALRVADFFIRHGVAFETLLQVVGLMIVSFLPTAVPVAFLIGVLAGFGRLSSDSELTAMKSVGFSLGRISAPVVLLSVGVGISSYFLNSEWVPLTERAYAGLMIRIANTQVIRAIEPKTFTKGFFGLLLYSDSVSSNRDRLDRVFIFDERDKEYPMTVVAQRGELVPLRPNTPGGASSVLKLSNGSIHRTRTGTEK